MAELSLLQEELAGLHEVQQLAVDKVRECVEGPRVEAGCETDAGD